MPTHAPLSDLLSAISAETKPVGKGQLTSIRPKHWPVALILVFTFSVASRAQSASTLTSVEQQVLLATNPTGKTLSKVTLSGATEWTAGSLQDSGNVVLTTSIDGSSSETWSLESQPHSLASTSFAQGRQCSYVDSAKNSHQDATVGCLRAVPWFAPWISILMLADNFLVRAHAVSLAGTNGMNAQLQYMTNFTNQNSGSPGYGMIRSGTVVSLVLDPATSLIGEINFVEPIDSDTSRIVQYRVVFSDYRPDAGLILPHHIQRFIQRTLQADITITNITAE